MPLKENLKKYRKLTCLTLFEASDAIGISVATLQRYESGTITHIPCRNIEKLAELYHTNTANLYGTGLESPLFLTPVLNANPLKITEFRGRMNYYSDVLGSEGTGSILKKYLALDIQGRHLISRLLDVEYQRCINEGQKK